MKGKLRTIFWFVVLGGFIAMLVTSRPGPMRILFSALLALWMIAALFGLFVRRAAARIREQEEKSKTTTQP
jgi:hypothetical protein